MGPSRGTVTRGLTVDVLSPGDGTQRVTMTLRYDIADPFAVQSLFRNPPDDDIPWVFARDLLVLGLDGPVGEGDVRIWPCRRRGGDAVRLALTSPDGAALLEVPAGDLHDFLGLTFRLCPWGHESEPLDLDGMLEDLLRT
ncbi:MAG TPA: SsgA family sporulation/cell division regulator [Actinomycetales bacterium]|nr:SsgA family sporulation/cell division regulator [Actinomycetales bacterium]